MKFSRLGAALALAASMPFAGATAQVWRAIGQHGGDVHALAADPNVDGRVYAATENGFFRSDDAGRHWTPVGGDLIPIRDIARPYAFVVDRDQAGRLWFMNVFGDLWRSDDGALSWSPTGYSAGRSTPDYTPYLTDVAGSSTGLLYADPQRYVYRSDDGGATFERGPGLSALTMIASDPTQPGRILVNLGGRLWQSSTSLWSVTPLTAANAGYSISHVEFLGGGRLAAISGDTVATSTDDGATWQSRAAVGAQSRLAATREPDPTLVATDGNTCRYSTDLFTSSATCDGGLPATPTPSARHLVAVRDGGGFRFLIDKRPAGVMALSAGSTQWTVSNDGLTAFDSAGLALLPGGEGTLFAGRNTQDFMGPRILRSADRGQHWTASLDGLASIIRDIRIDPTTLGLPGGAHLYAAGYGYRGSAPYNSGIYKSTDGGASWVSLDGGLPANANPPGGVLMQLARRVLPDPRSCATPPAVGNCSQGPLQRIYAISRAGSAAWSVLRSDNAGASWFGVGSGLPRSATAANGYEDTYNADIALDAQTGFVYVATTNSRESYDEDAPYVPTLPNGVFRSDNRGTTWAHRSAGLPFVAGSATTQADVWALATHPRRRGVLWAAVDIDGNSTQIYKSINDTGSWTAVGAPLGGCEIRALEVDTAAPDVLYAVGIAVGPRPGCVWRSEDGGSSWTAIDAGLPVREVYRLLQHPDDRRRLILSTDRGVWEGLVASDRIFDDAHR